MKRVSLFIVTLFLLSSLYSQEAKYEGHIEFGSNFQVGAETSIAQSIISYEILSTNGCRFNDYFFLGLGVGIEYSFWREREPHFWRDYYYMYENYSLHIPLFMRFKANFTKTKVSPYFLLNAGYNFIILSPFKKDSQDDLYKGNGALINPCIGFDVNFNEKIGLFFHAGYHIHRNTSSEVVYTHNSTRHSVSLNLGVKF